MLKNGTDLQPEETQCKNLLNSVIFSGGLQVLQPANPFDEEKGEARSSGSTPTDSGHILGDVPEIPSTVNYFQFIFVM